MSYLTIKGLDKSFGDNHVLKHLDLSLDQGESVVLLGPSGCGKTTCLRMVAGFEEPDSGEISLNGKTLVGERAFVPPNKRKMSVVFQNYALWPHLTVEQNISYGLKLTKAPATEVKRKTADALELVQLSGMGKRYINQLSGGQQQRIALARALVNSPDLLLLDEPLSNLDTRLREETRFEIQRIQRELGVSMIYVTHDQEEALSLADRIVVMNQGRVEQMGTPAEIYDRPVSRYVAASLGPVNVLPGKLLGGDEKDGALVEVGPHKFAARNSAVDHTAVPDADVNLLVRPSSISLTPTHGGGPESNAQIEEALFFGSYVEYKIRLEHVDNVVKVRAPRNPLLQNGDRVVASVDPQAAAVTLT